MGALSKLWSRWTGAGLLEEKSVDDFPWSGTPPADWLLSGASMSLERAVGVPALLGVILRLSQGAGMVPQLVYRDGEVRSRATGSWQDELLHRRPSSESTPFSFRSDMAMSLAASGFVCVRKFKARDQVKELLPLDCERMTPKRVTGRLVFEDRTGLQTVVRDSSEVIYVRGPAMRGAVQALSPIGAARTLVATGLSRGMWERSFIANYGRPDVAVMFPETVSAKQAEDYRPGYEAMFSGPTNAGKMIPLGGGAKLEPIPVSLQDAQFVEAAQLSAREIAGIYGVPRSFLSQGDVEPSELDWRFFVTFGLGWITTAIDQAFSADLDLFPAGSGMFCESLSDALLKQDAKTRYDSYRLARQGSWITANEVRAKENYPAVEGGDEIQLTPVGGAVNPALAKFDEDALLGELLARMRDQRDLETAA